MQISDADEVRYLWPLFANSFVVFCISHSIGKDQ